MLHRARRTVQQLGVDVRRFPRSEPGYQRVQLLRHHSIDHVVDVGASDGRFGAELRRFGYEGKIVSFEPLAASYARLAEVSRRDPLWTAIQVALGESAEEVAINVASNDGASSSVLPMLPSHRRAAPEATFERIERVMQVRLDSVSSEVVSADARTYLKLDVQGYERSVLAGAQVLLPRCTGVELELSFVPLYEGGMTYREALDEMERLGFSLAFIVPGFSDRATGQMLQADAAFLRLQA